MSNYIRLCETVKDFGKLIEKDKFFNNPYKFIKNVNKDWYVSVYDYTEEHKKQFDEKGSIEGITDVQTDRLVIDFDEKGHGLDQAHNDALECVNRLVDKGFGSEDINFYFSGNKGFHIELYTKDQFTPQQANLMAEKIAGDLKTFDTTMYNPSRIFRFPGTKNIETGLFKTPLYEDEINSQVEDIVKIAKESRKKTIKFETKLPETFIPTEIKKEPKVESTLEFTRDIDFSKKPRGWNDAKFALLNGLIPNGIGHNAFLCLASMFKTMGYPPHLVIQTLSGVNDLREKRGFPRHDESDIEHVVKEVYSPKWNGGTYSVYEQGWLRNYALKNGFTIELINDDVVTTKEVFDIFKGYAQDFQNNIIPTGIAQLDNKAKFLVGTSNAILAPPGVGKCLGKGTPVLMYDGSIKKVEEIKSGDLLMGDDSTPRKVLSICQGTEKLYKIKQQIGDDYIVNESHILSLKAGATFNPKKRTQKYNYGKVYDISVKDYLNESKMFKKYVKGYKVAVDFPEKKLIIDPYFLGYWLGNGTSNKTQITIHKQDIEVINFLKEFAYSNELNINFRENSQNSFSVDFSRLPKSVNHLKTKLEKLNLINNKHIPNDYKINSRKNRLALLAGLLDSDGSYDWKRNRYELTTKSDKLKDDILYLLRSLNLRVNYEYKNAKYKSFTKGKLYEGESLVHRIFIQSNQLSEIPCLLPRKKAENKELQIYQDLTQIQIEPLDIGEYYGFEIDGNKRFLLGDFTVTHNTSLILNILNNTSLNGLSSIFFSYDMYHSLVFTRMVQRHFGYTQDEIFHIAQTDEQQLYHFRDVLSKEYTNVQFCFKSGQTTKDIEQTIVDTQQKIGEKVKLVAIDYNELVVSELSDPTGASAQVAQDLRRIANDHSVCVLMLLQPSKLYAKPDEDLFTYSAAKGSSSIAQSVTLMYGLSRPGWNPKNPSQDKFLTISCLKNRMGGLFSLDFRWEGLTGQITELSLEEAEELDDLRNRKKEEKEKADSDWRS